MNKIYYTCIPNRIQESVRSVLNGSKLLEYSLSLAHCILIKSSCIKWKNDIESVQWKNMIFRKFSNNLIISRISFEYVYPCIDFTYRYTVSSYKNFYKLFNLLKQRMVFLFIEIWHFLQHVYWMWHFVTIFVFPVTLNTVLCMGNHSAE